MATGQQVVRIRLGGAGQTKGLAFSPDGRRLASTTPEFHVYLWDVRTRQPTKPLTGHTGEVFCVTFSRDGRRLASASLDRTVRVWDVEKGDCQAILRGHTDDVFTAAFDPSGTLLATAGRDRSVWLWDLARGEEGATRLPGHTSYIWSLAFSPDGARRWRPGSGDSTVRLWDTAPLKGTVPGAPREAEALRPAADRLVANHYGGRRNQPGRGSGRPPGRQRIERAAPPGGPACGVAEGAGTGTRRGQAGRSALTPRVTAIRYGRTGWRPASWNDHTGAQDGLLPAQGIPEPLDQLPLLASLKEEGPDASPTGPHRWSRARTDRPEHRRAADHHLGTRMRPPPAAISGGASRFRALASRCRADSVLIGISAAMAQSGYNKAALSDVGHLRMGACSQSGYRVKSG